MGEHLASDPWARYRQAFDRVRRHVEERFGVKVRRSADLGANTGSLDGSEITINARLEPDLALFVLVHLFGHAAQWNTDERWRAVGLTGDDLDMERTPEDFGEIHSYEQGASQYGLGLLRETGLSDLEQWYSDWTQADWRYLLEAYRIRRCPSDYRAFFRPGAEPVHARSVPRFQPQKWGIAYSF
jgi:hypothetical protein